jgi:hypothetical protein
MGGETLLAGLGCLGRGGLGFEGFGLGTGGGLGDRFLDFRRLSFVR